MEEPPLPILLYWVGLGYVEYKMPKNGSVKVGRCGKEKKEYKSKIRQLIL